MIAKIDFRYECEIFAMAAKISLSLRKFRYAIEKIISLADLHLAPKFHSNCKN